MPNRNIARKELTADLARLVEKHGIKPIVDILAEACESHADVVDADDSDDDRSSEGSELRHARAAVASHHRRIAEALTAAGSAASLLSKEMSESDVKPVRHLLPRLENTVLLVHGAVDREKHRMLLEAIADVSPDLQEMGLVKRKERILRELQRRQGKVTRREKRDTIEKRMVALLAALE